MLNPKLRFRLSARMIVLTVTIAILLIVVGAAAATSSPRSCRSCHTMRPFVDSLSKSPHSNVNCYRCHLQGGAWSFPAQKISEWTSMIAGESSGRGLTGATKPVSSAACLKCHKRVFDGVIEKNGIRINHESCAAAPAACTDCHNSTAHGKATRWIKTPVMEECVRCHNANDGPTACDSCHRGERQTDRLRMGPWQVTHGSTWKATHGLGDLRFCGTCHSSEYCVQCHGTPLPHAADFGRTHGAQAKLPGAKCLNCHDKKQLCDSCHRIEMPHPAGFLPNHSAVVKQTGEKACHRCHDTIDCQGCHEAHVHPGRTDGTLGKGPDGAIGITAPKVKP
jgi:nitrate/TMAO reductase-like tetraheme cytochrome c subunit